MIADLESRNVY